MYRLGHDLVRLVDKSAPDSRTASYTRADVWVETIELRQTDRESDVATAEGPTDDDRRMA